MKKKIFVPMTLEATGSDGVLLNDTSVFKVIIVIVGAAIADVTLLKTVLFNVSNLIRIPVLIILTIAIFIWGLNKFVFNVNSLKDLYLNQMTNNVVDVSKYSDIYRVMDNGVCLHDSGHISMFIEIVRGATTGLTETDILKYLQSKQSFEDHLARENYSFKKFNFENIDNDFTSFNKQLLGCIALGLTGLHKRLNLKYKYLEEFMDNAVRDERELYVVYSKFTDISKFVSDVESFITYLNSPVIKYSQLLTTEKEISKVGKDFFEVEIFNLSSTEDDDLDKILILKNREDVF